MLTIFGGVLAIELHRVIENRISPKQTIIIFTALLLVSFGAYIVVSEYSAFVSSLILRHSTQLISIFSAAVGFFGLIFSVLSYKKQMAESTRGSIVDKMVSIHTEPEEQETEERLNSNLKLDETATSSNVQIAVVSAKKSSSYTYGTRYGRRTENAKPGNVFILVDTEIKNIGADCEFVTEYNFSLTDSTGYKYDTEHYAGDDKLKNTDLYQNQRIRGIVLFEIPQAATGLKLLYYFENIGGTPEIASWAMDIDEQDIGGKEDFSSSIIKPGVLTGSDTINISGSIIKPGVLTDSLRLPYISMAPSAYQVMQKQRGVERERCNAFLSRLYEHVNMIQMSGYTICIPLLTGGIH